MSRFLLLLVFLGWMSWTSQVPDSPLSPHDPWAGMHLAWHGTFYFISAYVGLILIMGIWSRRVARHVGMPRGGRKLRNFQWAMGAARLFIPVWFITGVYAFGWGPLVYHSLSRIGIGPAHVDTPGLLVASLPAFLAWMGLWWSQYPADMSVREQGLLAQLDEGAVVYQQPSLGLYMQINLRLQLLFTFAPVLLLVVLRDVVSQAMRPLGLSDTDSSVIQLLISLSTAGVAFLIAPELLKRVLHTEPMPDGHLRRRLEAICRRNNVGYRQILLWRTANHMGNAAVMGLTARFRYILMSDLLLETMTDEQIEAVFAHEIGHVIHKHMLWFALFFVTATFAAVGFAVPVGAILNHWTHPPEWLSPALSLLAGVLLLVNFLFLSRKFERQADVFAARSIEADAAVMPRIEAPAPADCHVGTYGATVFSSALRQVARVNNIPITALSWCHGSIARRIGYLEDLSGDSSRTRRFDRFMGRLYALLTIALIGFGVWAAVTLYVSRNAF